MLVAPLGIAWLAAILLAPLDGRRRSVGWLAVAALAGMFIATLSLVMVVLQEGPRELVTGDWPVGVGITLRGDLPGVVFATVSLTVLLVALLYEVIGGVQAPAFPATVLFLATGLTGLFLTGDAFNFYVFFEVSMTAAFVLASYGQGSREMRAALTFMVVNLLGSALFLAGIAALYHVTGTLEMRGIAAWARTVEPSATSLIATIFFIAFSLKLGVFPFHFWLPPVYRDVRPAVAAILSGAVANIGSYGLLRFGVEILPRERELGTTAVLLLGVISILYGAHQAISTRTASEMLAYSSISQAGFIMLAFGLGGLSGYAAVVLYMAVNALNKAILFLATGLRGWLVGAAFVIGALSVAGVPPAVGFFGKAALFQAGLAARSAFAVAIVFVGGALAFVYMFQSYQREFWVREPGGVSSPLAARILLLLLAVLIVSLGVWPEPLLAVSERVAASLARDVP